MTSVARTRNLRVAVVGSGPAGMFTAGELTSEGDADVDIIERLPAPMGLLRYGVAPDHTSIKSAATIFEEILARPSVRLFCNVPVGHAVSIEELRSRYHAVVYATGATSGRDLMIPGEQLPGSLSAAEFVRWYNGHPEATKFDLAHTRRVGVVGAGNVALDVARMLLKSPTDLRQTDVPAPVLDALEVSGVTDVHVFARREAIYSKYTTKELREIGKLTGVDVIVDPGQVESDPTGEVSMAAKRNLDLFRAWSTADRTDAPRRIHFHFATRPVSVLGTDHVTALRVERTDGSVKELSIDLLLRAVGYFAQPLDGVPSDQDTRTIPHQNHRVVRDGMAPAGEYAVGWAKRGPSGVIGTNRADAEETADVIRADRSTLVERSLEPVNDLPDLLSDRGVPFLDRDSWAAIVRSEADLGARLGRARVKLHEWEAMVEAGSLHLKSSTATI